MLCRNIENETAVSSIFVASLGWVLLASVSLAQTKTELQKLKPRQRSWRTREFKGEKMAEATLVVGAFGVWRRFFSDWKGFRKWSPATPVESGQSYL